MASTKDYNSFISIHLKFKGRNREMLNIAGDQKDAIQDHDGTPFFNRLDGNN